MKKMCIPIILFFISTAYLFAQDVSLEDTLHWLKKTIEGSAGFYYVPEPSVDYTVSYNFNYTIKKNQTEIVIEETEVKEDIYADTEITKEKNIFDLGDIDPNQTISIFDATGYGDENCEIFVSTKKHAKSIKSTYNNGPIERYDFPFICATANAACAKRSSFSFTSAGIVLSFLSWTSFP